MTTDDDFVELFRLHYPRVVRALALAGAPRPHAEDLAQEAFARTFGHWRRVRRGSSPAGYVYRVAFRLLKRRSPGGATLAGAGTDEARADAPHRATLEHQAVTRIDLERSLEAMPPRRRACAVMCLCLDLSPSDAAEALGIKAATVRKQLGLARSALQGGLGRIDDGF